MEIILFVVLVSLLFPGTKSGGGFEFMMVPVFFLCAALVYAFFGAVTYGAVFVYEATENGWLGLLTWFALFFGALFANRSICIHIERRQATAQSGGQGRG